MGRGLLVAHQYMAQRRIRGERVIEGHNSPARVAKEQFDTFTHQRFAKYLASAQLSRFLQAVLTCSPYLSGLSVLLLCNCRSNNHER